MVALAAALFFALVAPAWGQSDFVDINQWGGANDAVDSAVIGNGQCQDCLNVEINKTGTSLRKRGGYIQTLDLGSGRKSVDSLTKFRNSNGDECEIISSSGTVYRATNGAAPVQVTTITASARLFCKENSGLAYCFSSSNDPPFTDDCNTHTLKTADSYPTGKSNAFSLDRHFVIGSTTSPNTMFVSRSGDVDFFTTGTSPDDAFEEVIGTPGDKLEAVIVLNGRPVTFKEFSIGGMNLTDQYNAPSYDIAQGIGVTNPEAIEIWNGWAYFKGSDNEFYRINGLPGVIEKLSTNISSTTAALLTGKSRSNIQTEKADWDAGNLTAKGANYPMRSDIIIGAVVPSSVTLIDTTSDQFALGSVQTNVDVITNNGAIILSSTTFTDSFDNLLLTNPEWIQSVNTWRASAGALAALPATGPSIAYSTSNVIAGSFKFKVKSTPQAPAHTYVIKFISTGQDIDDPGYAVQVTPNVGADTETVQIIEKPGDGVLIEGTGVAHQAGVNAQYEVLHSTGGSLYLYVDEVLIGTAADTSVIDFSSYTIVSVTGANLSSIFIDDFKYYGYKSSGSLVSRSFDTGFNTAVFGVLNATVTFTDANTSPSLYTQSSSDETTWTAVAVASDTQRITSTPNQYIRYRTDLYASGFSTNTPVVEAVGLLASTTGQYITQCINTTPIDSWGTINVGGVLDSKEGNFSFALSTATACAGTGTTWTDISTGTTVSIDTGAATKLRITWETITSATVTARIDDVVLRWNEGSVAPPSYANYWDDAIYFSVANSGVSNNQLLKLDLLHGEWFIFNVPAAAMNTFDNVFTFGCANCGKVYKFSDIDPDKAPTSDDGSNINALFRTKDFGGSDPFTESTFDTISLITRKEEGGTMTTTWRLNGGGTASGNFDVSLSTGDNAVRHNYRFPVGQRGTFMNLEFGNNSTNKFEILGVRVGFTPEPWRPLPE